MNKILCIITGPTASGKTDLTIELAEIFNTSIISADSRQFYKELKIGSAAPTPEQLKRIKHYFIANLSVTDNYNVSKFENEANELLIKLFKNTNIVFLTGGSGLYIDAICKGIDLLPDTDPSIREELNINFQNNGMQYLQNKLKELDPEYYNIVDKANPIRLIRAIEICIQTGKKYSSIRGNRNVNREYKIIKFAIDINRDQLYNKISLRTDQMLKNGFIEEAKSLMKYRNLTPLKTVGYKELFDYFDNKDDLEKTIENIKTNTRRYAKRQITWFKKDKEYQWINNFDINFICEKIKKD